VDALERNGGPAGEAQAVRELSSWLRTPEGLAYRKRLGIKLATDEDIAASAYHEVAHYLPNSDVISLARTAEGVTPRQLKEAVPNAYQRPLVHTGQLGENLAHSNRTSQVLDRVMTTWFRTMTEIPADRMSRHPLFNQLYEGHATRLARQEIKQGVKISQADADRLAETARRLALRDTRNLVFDIAHRSDAAAALRFMSPFFSATTEAWQRWARIIADRPEIVGYATKFFNTPAALGHMVDADGNHVDANGYSTDPATGKKRLVPKGERKILVRVPGFIAHSSIGKELGMDASGSWLISQDSMNLVTQGDPWFNPGVGPMVQIPVNALVKDKPEWAEVARKAGILPFGPETGSAAQQLSSMLLPSTLKNAMTAYDTSDERYQTVRLHILQKAAFEHATLGKPMPSAKELADQTRNYWLWSSAISFTQPFATQRQDPFQFYRDQYNALRRKNYLTADQEFLDKYGESYFIFAQSMSDNTSGIAATSKAVRLVKQYGDMIAAQPELAALIVGPEGNGPFSPEAYAYELNNPLVPGGSEMMRTKMSADQAMKENQKRLGWSQFNTQMNRLYAELSKRGMISLEDKGAEDLNLQKKALVGLLSTPTMPDGTANRYYNAQWAEDYATFNSQKYAQLIPKLQQLADSKLADQPQRSDLRALRDYLEIRSAVTDALAQRKAAGGDGTLSAKSNRDIRRAWVKTVGGLVEKDTRFGDLYHRYLSRDLDVDAEREADQ
jgi:hypothetical protein